jgi:hypothetical protein
MRLPQIAWKKSYGAFGRWGMAAGKVEVLLVVSGPDVDRSAEVYLVNMDVNIKESGKRREMIQINQTGW